MSSTSSSKDERRTSTYWLAQVVLLACAAAPTAFVLSAGGPRRYVLFNGMFVADLMSHVLKLVTYVAVSAALVYSRQYLIDRGLLRGEFLALLLFALLGMMVMICATSFLTLYLGLELMSLCAVRDGGAAARLGARHRGGDEVLRAGRARLGPAALRHVDDLRRHRHAAAARGRGQAAALAGNVADQRFLVFGLVFVVAGIAFKLGVVPFHMWIPDVYHGAPTAVTLFIGSAPKLAAFALAMRLLVNGLLALAADWQQMLVLLAVLSMALGNIIAIAQTNLKRMLAYSTIAHMGFLLLGLLSGVVGGNCLNAPTPTARRCST